MSIRELEQLDQLKRYSAVGKSLLARCPKLQTRIARVFCLVSREIAFKIKSIRSAGLDTQNDETRGLRVLCDAFP
jgi:hypothetical protein